ncbi:MAG: AbrB family transcriptional regulator, partial [Bacillota bacterium]
SGFPVPRAASWIQVAVQIALGVVVGQQVTKDTLTQLGGIVWAASAVLAWSLASAFGMGLLIEHLAHTDYITAVLSCCPGGLPEMSVLAIALGSETSVVVVLQTIRILAVLIGLPALMAALARKIPRWEGERALPGDSDSPGGAEPVHPASSSPSDPAGTAGELATARGAVDPGIGLSRCYQASRVVVTFVVGACGGIAALWLGLPAAGLLGSMVVVGLAQVAGLRFAAIPSTIQRVSRAAVGILIGSTVSRGVVAGMASLIVPGIVLASVLIASGLAVGLIVRRVTGWPIEVCILSSAAAGLVSLSAVAQSLGLDPVRISLLHLVRIVSIVVVVPLVLSALI